MSRVISTRYSETAAAVKTGFFCIDGQLKISFGRDTCIPVQAFVDIDDTWVSLDKVQYSEMRGIQLKASGVTLYLRADGSLRVDTETNQCIRKIRFELNHRFLNVFTQGYQTWNLSKSNPVGVSRYKSIASKFGLSGMFHDTDSWVWQRNDSGIDSHGVVVLETFGNKESKLLLSMASSKSSTAAFWITEKGVTWVVDFGTPGKASSEISETFCIIEGADGHALLSRYGQTCKSCLDDNSVDKQLSMKSSLRDLGHSPVGWGSWYEYYENVTSNDIDTTLQAIGKDPKLSKCIEVIQLDDGFQSQTGDWLTTQKSFGSDLPQVADKIRNEGFTPGLWIAPFIASKTSKVFQDHPDWFLRKLKKPKQFVVGHFNLAWKRNGSLKSAIMHVLDLSNPEVLIHLTTTFKELAFHWDFFKVDFLAAGMREGIRFDSSKSRVEAYIDGVKAIRRGIGSSSFLLGCGAPLLPSAQSNCFDAMRVSCDTAEKWEPSWVLNKVIGDWEIPCCKNALWGNMTRSFMQDNLWKFNDPDCLVLRKQGNTMNEDQVKTQVTLLGMTGGLLLFTDNMATLEDYRKDIAFSVLPSTSLTGTPVNDLTLKGMPSVFGLGDRSSGFAVLAYCNWDQRAKHIDNMSVGYDFWGHCRIRNRAHVEPDAVCAVQYSPLDSVLIGTSLHLDALADKRIVCTQKESNGSLKCTVYSGSDLALNSGFLVFNSALGEIVLGACSNIKILEEFAEVEDEEKNTVALKVEIEAYPWTIQVSKRLNH